MFINYIPVIILAALVGTFLYAKYSNAPQAGTSRTNATGVPGIISENSSQSRSTDAERRAANVVTSGISSKSETEQPVIISKTAVGSVKRATALTETDVIVAE